MAFTALTPQTMTITYYPGFAQANNSPAVTGPTGSAVNLSAWTDLVAQLMPPSPSPNDAPVTFGTVTGSSTGVITLTTSATDLTTVASGSARLIISGKPTSADAVQLLCTGAVTINATI